MKNDYFDIHIEELENMSDSRVVIYTNPKNRYQLECMMLHLQNEMGDDLEEDDQDGGWKGLNQ